VTTLLAVTNLSTGIPRAVETGAFLSFHIGDRFFDNRWKGYADAVGDSEQNFNLWIPQPPVHEAQHCLRDATPFENGVIGKFPAFALLSQEPNHFLADSFIVRKPMHSRRGSQKTPLDIYFSTSALRRSFSSNELYKSMVAFGGLTM
jgi:hypothetical protein